MCVSDFFRVRVCVLDTVYSVACAESILYEKNLYHIVPNTQTGFFVWYSCGVLGVSVLYLCVVPVCGGVFVWCPCVVPLWYRCVVSTLLCG